MLRRRAAVLTLFLSSVIRQRTIEPFGYCESSLASCAVSGTRLTTAERAEALAARTNIRWERDPSSWISASRFLSRCDKSF